jgi:UDP-glucose 4-epimerase
MKVVVTGGAGFIGANLCRELASLGVDEVVALDDLSTGRATNLAGLPIRLVEGDVRDEGLVSKTLAGADSIVHLAARSSVPRSLQNPLATNEVNVTGTLRVLEAARISRAHVMIASSSSVYGRNPILPKDEALTPAPMSPYAASKLAAESYAAAYSECFGTRTIVFRFFNVFGPLQAAGHPYAAVIPTFISAAFEGRPLAIHGDGLQTRDFTYVGSVVRILTRAVRERAVHDGPVNLAFGYRHSLLHVISELESILGRSLSVKHVESRPGDVRDSQANTARLQMLFPDEDPLSLRRGLEETVRWFRTLD